MATARDEHDTGMRPELGPAYAMGRGINGQWEATRAPGQPAVPGVRDPAPPEGEAHGFTAGHHAVQAEPAITHVNLRRYPDGLAHPVTDGPEGAMLASHPAGNAEGHRPPAPGGYPPGPAQGRNPGPSNQHARHARRAPGEAGGR